MPRESVVRQLVDDMAGTLTDACLADPTISGDEVVSAILSQAHTFIVTARKHGANMEILRGGVERLLIECADDRRPS